MPAVLDPFMDARFTFRATRSPLPGELRPVWRVSLLAMCIESCRGNSATPQQLHVLDLACRNREAGNALLNYLTKAGTSRQVAIRLDPAVNRAVRWGLGCGLFARDGVIRIQLSESGASYVNQVRSASAMEHEQAFLASLPRKLNQSEVDRLFDSRGVL